MSTAPKPSSVPTRTVCLASPEAIWFDNYDEDVPHALTYPVAPLYHLLDEAAQNFGSRIAVEFQNTRMTYAQLQVQAERVAAGLRARGVLPGDRVAIMLPNLPQVFVAFWGVIKAGAVAVMTNPLYMEHELVHLVRDSGARHIILLDIFLPKIMALRDQLGLEVCIVTRIREALRFPLSWLQPFSARKSGTWVAVPWDGRSVVRWADLLKTKDRLSVPVQDPDTTLAVIQYTGGTTGLAKGAMLTHSNFLANVEQYMAIIRQSAADEHVFLALLPIFHVFGLCITCIVPARMASKVVPMPRYVPGDMLESFKKYKFTVFVGAPSVYISLLQQKNLAQYDLRHIKFCISGSAPMPVEWFKRFADVTGTRITEGFGLTEASPGTHANPVYGDQKPGSIGMPLPGTDARIVDLESGLQTLPTNEIGELVIRGPQVMAGYWQREDETARTIRDGWLFTGDIAYMDDDGFFYIVDRKKDLIIVGGYNVYPREIDEVLHTHPKIREAVTVGVQHRSRGECIKAYIVPKEGETLTVPEVVAYCRQKLASFKVPRSIEFRDELPKSMMGKVLRRILRDEEKTRIVDGSPDAVGETSQGSDNSPQDACDCTQDTDSRGISTDTNAPADTAGTATSSEQSKATGAHAATAREAASRNAVRNDATASEATGNEATGNDATVNGAAINEATGSDTPTSKDNV